MGIYFFETSPKKIFEKDTLAIDITNFLNEGIRQKCIETYPVRSQGGTLHFISSATMPGLDFGHCISTHFVENCTFVISADFKNASY